MRIAFASDSAASRTRHALFTATRFLVVFADPCTAIVFVLLLNSPSLVVPCWLAWIMDSFSVVVCMVFLMDNTSDSFVFAPFPSFIDMNRRVTESFPKHFCLVQVFVYCRLWKLFKVLEVQVRVQTELLSLDPPICQTYFFFFCLLFFTISLFFFFIYSILLLSKRQDVPFHIKRFVALSRRGRKIFIFIADSR